MLRYTIGKLLLVEALLLLPSLVISFAEREQGTQLAFAIPIALLALLGLLGGRPPKDKNIYAREGFVIVALSWMLVSAAGALPFLISGAIPNYIDCFFETVSGFTTTGATVLSNVEALPNSLLFWRSFTHWVGGMGVLVFVLAVLPQSDARSMHLLRAEMPGPKIGKFVSKVRASARILYGIYLILTLLEVVLLVCGGMPVFDSFVNSFSTAGTGGFSIMNASIAAYDSVYADVVITVFMFLFGINFNLFFFLLVGNFREVFGSEELRWYFGITVGSMLLIALNIMHLYQNFWDALRYSSFQVVSIMTTTGFVTADYLQWPMLSQLILLGLMFVGASSGSTGGGLKVVRVVLMGKLVGRETRRLRFPRAVKNLYFDGKPVDNDMMNGVGVYVVTYTMIYAASVLLIAFDQLDFTSNFSAVATCINNVGPGLGSVGPVSNFAHLSWLSKLTLSFDMLFGRLELFPMLILFSPSTWKRR